MSLTARLTAFFLATLALVLAGFSVTLYLLAQTYLDRQTDHRLAAALDTLTAAVEIEPDGLDWEPQERRLTLGQDPGADQVRWTVHDGDGRLVDCSSNLDRAGDTTGFQPVPDLAEGTTLLMYRDGQPWHLVQRRMLADRLQPATADGGREPDTGDARPSTLPHRHAALLLTAGVSLAPVRGTLHTLAATLSGLSLGLWLLAALLGRWLCRRALAPVTRMAAAARAMSAADLAQRLPVPGTRDELGDLGQAFNGLLDRLHEAFERQRRFTGDASHQLRTPLTALLGQLDVTLRRDRSAGDYREALERVQGQADRLRQIVEMLLFLARADAEAPFADLEPLDLAAWLPVHLQAWSEHARAADLRVEGLAGQPLWVRAHGPLLGQLLDNVLENACKYSAAGTPVTVCVEAAAGGVQLTVADLGSGIAREDLPHLFEPFYRSADARRRGLAGVGLGLAVCRRIAQAFGGSLEAWGEPGRGSRFTLRLAQTDLKG